MIPDKVIDDIRDRTDIVQLIGSFLELKRSGRNFKALCPFHAEKTPSFMVSPEKQIYHCFGCGKGGNVFHFLMNFEGVSFVEAVGKLGTDLGIDISTYLSAGRERGQLDPYYRAMEFAAAFYRKALAEDQGADPARRYLGERDLGGEVAERFGLGFAPAGWDHLYRAAMQEGISRDILLELNLILRSRGGSGFRDYFRNRIIFPIATLSNRVVGFAGRVLDRSEPKYLNSMESPIYSKSRILYGLNHAKEAIRKDGSAIIVEGYIDYLMLWKKGIKNLSAVCGTSLTEGQARLLARYTKRVYIINDGDRAGVRAAVRAADQLVVQGLEAQVVILPEGEDPDSFVRKKGADELRMLMRSAPHYFTYLKQEATTGERTAYKKSKVISHLLDTISRVQEDVQKEIYLQEISGLFEIPVEALKRSLRAQRKPRRAAQPEHGPTDDRRVTFQKQLFRIGLEDERYARRILDELIEEDLEGIPSRSFYKALDLALKSNIDITSSEFIGGIKDAELSRFAAEIALMEPPPGPVEEFLSDTIKWLKRAALRDELDLMRKRITELQTEHGPGANGEEIAIAEAYRKVARELKKLSLKEDDLPDES